MVKTGGFGASTSLHQRVPPPRPKQALLLTHQTSPQWEPLQFPYSSSLLEHPFTPPVSDIFLLLSRARPTPNALKLLSGILLPPLGLSPRSSTLRSFLLSVLSSGKVKRVFLQLPPLLLPSLCDSASGKHCLPVRSPRCRPS